MQFGAIFTNIFTFHIAEQVEPRINSFCVGRCMPIDGKLDSSPISDDLISKFWYQVKSNGINFLGYFPFARCQRQRSYFLPFCYLFNFELSDLGGSGLFDFLPIPNMKKLITSIR